MTTILGIDPGTAICGWGVVKKDQRPKTKNQRDELRLVAYGCITTSKDSSTGKRLSIIQKELKKIIKRYKPQKIGVESLFFFKNLKTAIKIAQVYGIIVLTVNEVGLPLVEVTPLQVKKAVSGYGRAEKIQVQKMVQRLLKLQEIPKPDDAADALAIAICASYF